VESAGGELNDATRPTDLLRGSSMWNRSRRLSANIRKKADVSQRIVGAEGVFNDCRGL
jgi:hypothetical protein